MAVKSVTALAHRTFDRHPWLIPLTIAIYTLILRLCAGPRIIDDAYISFRYAEHIASGHGFVFNDGQHVLGTTTPLYTILLAALLLITHVPLPSLSVAIAGLSDGCMAAIVYALTARVGSNRLAAVLASVMVASATTTFFYAQSGMETSLFTLLLVATAWRYVEGDRSLWGVPAGLAIMTRPEAILLALLLLLDSAGRTRRIPWRALALIMAIVLPWVVWATWYFGQPISQSILAKGGHVYLMDWRVSVFSLLIQHMSAIPFGLAWSQAGFVVLMLTGVFSWYASSKRAPRFHAVLLFIPLFVAAYAFSAIYRQIVIFDWYPVPLVPFYCMALWLGAAEALSHTQRAIRLSVLILLGVAVMAGQLSALSTTGRLGQGLLAPRYGSGPWRESLYAMACRHLNGQLNARTLIAAPEIGAIGYFCHAPILDTVGLVSTGLGRYYPLPPSELATNTAIPPALIAARQPDYVISLDIFIRKSLLTDPRFRRDYVEIWHIDTTALGSHELVVYRRRSRSTPA